MVLLSLHGRSYDPGAAECPRADELFKPVCWRGVSTENDPQSARVLLFGIARWREVRTRPLQPLLTTGRFLGLLGLELAHGENALHEHDTR